MKSIKFFTLLTFSFILLLSCSSESNDDDVIDMPETFGDWSPAFSNQTSNFTQTRAGNQGTTESRSISVTSTAVSEETDEYLEEDDINGDNDQVDDITLITTTYTASNNLGSHQIITYTVDEDRDPTFFNANSGFWYSEIFAEVGNGLESAGYLAYDIYLGDVIVYVSDDGECINEVDGESDGGDDDIVLNTEGEFLGAVYDLYIEDLDTTFDVYTGWERLIDNDGNPYLSYFVAYYDVDFTYYLPSASEFLEGSQEAIDFVLDADLYIAGNLALLDDSLIPAECSTSGKNLNSKSSSIPGFRKILKRFVTK